MSAAAVHTCVALSAFVFFRSPRVKQEQWRSRGRWRLCSFLIVRRSVAVDRSADRRGRGGGKKALKKARNTARCRCCDVRPRNSNVVKVWRSSSCAVRVQTSFMCFTYSFRNYRPPDRWMRESTRPYVLQ